MTFCKIPAVSGNLRQNTLNREGSALGVGGAAKWQDLYGSNSRGQYTM